MNKKLLSGVLAVMLATSMTPKIAHAASVEGYNASDGITVPFSKVLHTNSLSEKYLTNFTFKFTPIEVTEVPQAAQGSVTMPTISDVTISQSEWNSAGDASENDGHLINKVLNKTSESVAFTEVGKYLYKLSEESVALDSVVTDTTEYYILFDVYKGENNKLVAQYYIYNSDPRDNNSATKTTAQFTNTVITKEDVYVEKQVTGAKGDTTREFEFTITLSDTDAHNYMKQELVNGVWQDMSGDGSTGIINNGTITINLKDDQRIYIEDLNVGSTYSITENIGTDRLLYTTNIDALIAEAGEDVENDVTISNVKVVASSDGKENGVVYTNNRDDLVNTGVVMDIIPYALIVMVSIAGIVIIAKKRTVNEEE